MSRPDKRAARFGEAHYQATIRTQTKELRKDRRRISRAFAKLARSSDRAAKAMKALTGILMRGSVAIHKPTGNIISRESVRRK